MTLGRLLIVSLLGNLIGCASYFKRQECEKINWFEHGQNVAMRGDRLDADPVIAECRKVEADIAESKLDLGFKSGMQKYCDPANAYKVGREGDPFVRDLCEGPTIRQLMSEHKRGIVDYCKKENAYQAGASGKKYRGVCTTAEEKDFLPGYRKGRKKWAEAMIHDKEALIKEKESQISSIERDKSSLEWQRSSLQSQKSSLESQKMHYFGQSGPEAASHAAMFDGQISSVDSQISSVDSEIWRKRNALQEQEAAREKLRKEITELRVEMASLDEETK
jgi:hypothetical protein